MVETIRLGVAVMGNIASVSLYAAPITTFRRVIRKKSTEEFSCIPYIIGLLNCLIFTWYGLPVVSNKWENFPLVTVNGVGIVLELSYVLIYFCYASSKGKAKVAMIAIPILLVFCITVTVSAFAFHDNEHRKLLVGSVGLCVSVAMYGSPLVAMGPSVIGIPLSILQLALHCKYRKRSVQESNKEDLEKGNLEKVELCELGNGGCGKECDNS
ncbi:PREDICTED: bidirectional sugar transporter SWEET3-like isoform X2 [Lupinus angustifolius]|uniref:bidirectional sugar transporter SWEET3-like isoform X2 n=1 Tax=Lupinus angustifolius TaxID=3871 RepID=UPI00092E4957|nr:PREDICTED: bidirectional sugar transporter SWEET3-like isoform X2 [Lupinus angustifolius]